jgi:hypothetical protein
MTASGQRPTRLELMGELGEWEVRLVTGEAVWLAAHAYTEEQGDHLFSAFLEGEPPIEIPIARIPSKLVAKVRGG